MARKKKPVTPGDVPACAAEVDWAEPVKKGRTYALDEFTEFYVAFAEEDKPEPAGAAMPTWDTLLASEEFEVGQAAVKIDSSVDFYMLSDIKGATPKTKYSISSTVTEFGLRLAASSIASMTIAFLAQ